MNSNTKNISRRKFINLSSMTGAAFTIGFYFPAAAKGAASILTANGADVIGVVLTSWISIDKTGLVTLVNHRSEMGQGSFQSVPQIIAEELEVDLDKVNIVFATGDQNKYGSQITGGSATVRGSYKALLLTGATAREMLITAAANKWAVNKSDCYAKSGEVIHRPSGKKLGYGDFNLEASSASSP